jgi:phosphatidylglycerophosphate synthase
VRNWTEETLERLRADRFTPSAWIVFLAASLQRARELRNVYPHAHRTLLVLASAGGVTCLVVGLAGQPRLAAVTAAWWLVTCLMADWHLGLLDGWDRLGVANALTLLRAGVVPPILLLGLAPAGVALFAAAGAADVLDGRLARRLGQTTRLGLWLDGSTDGLVVSAAALVALPYWAAAVVVTRYALPWLAIAAVYFVKADRPEFERPAFGRAAGLVLFAGITLAFLSLPGAALLAVAGAFAGLATVSASVMRVHAYAR